MNALNAGDCDAFVMDSEVCVLTPRTYESER